MSQSDAFREFWTSKSVIEGNNYDYSQGDSCLRSHSSRYLALKEQKVNFISAFDQLLAVIDDEQQLRTKILENSFFQTISTLDRDTLNVR